MNKKILLIFPSYHVYGIDDRLRYVLEQSNVLPKDLNEYGNTGYKHDMFRIQSLFVNVQFDEFRLLDGEVLSRHIDEGIHWLLSADVAALVYCGHGKNQGSVDHGTMVCSFNQPYSSDMIDEQLVRSNFTGTFLRILNMCEATGTPQNQVCDNNVSTIQTSQISEISQSFHLPIYKGITLMATPPFGQTYGGVSGSSFVYELSEMIKCEGAFRYENLKAMFVKYGHNGVCKLTHPLLMGMFGDSATFAPVSVASVNTCLEGSKSTTNCFVVPKRMQSFYPYAGDHRKHACDKIREIPGVAIGTILAT